MSDLDQSLTEAYELIEEGDLDSARSILEPILEKDKDNIDVWWLYVHAIDDPNQAQDALENVKRLDPNYPGISALSNQLNQNVSLLDEIEVDDDWDDDEDDFEIAETSDSSSRRIPILPLTVVGLMLIAIVVIFVALPNSDKDDSDEVNITAVVEPTDNIFSLATVEVTDEVTPMVDIEVTSEITDEASVVEVETTDEASVANTEFSEIVELLDEFVLADISPDIITSDLGTTLSVSICKSSDVLLRDQITNAMVQLSSAETTAFGEAEAMAISILDCNDNNSVINILGVAISHAKSFAEGNITESEFRSKWRPVG